MPERRTILAASSVLVVVGALVAAFAMVSVRGQVARAAGSSAVTVTLTSTVPRSTTPQVTVPALVTTSAAAADPATTGATDGTTHRARSTTAATATTHRAAPSTRHAARTTHGAVSTKHTKTAPTADRTGSTEHRAPARHAKSEASHPAKSHTSAPHTSAPAIVDKAIDPAASPSTGRIARAVDHAVATAAAHDTTEGVVIVDRKTGKTIYRANATTAMPAVSIAKVLFAVDEIRRAGGGSSLDPAAAGDLKTMIARSDDRLADQYYGANGEGAIVTRVARADHLPGTHPAPNPRYWGGITTTAQDVASLLTQSLADPSIGPTLAAAMKAATPIAADGYDQAFGMNAVTGAGSKQGWGCCLAGVVAIHSVGFTDSEIVVVLSSAPPDATGINVPDVTAFADDPGFLTSVAAVTATVKAAVDPGG